MDVANTKRLRDLMESVATKNPNRFDMGNYYRTEPQRLWFDDLPKNSLTWATECLGADELDPDPEHCGAAACMAGWCQLAFAVTPGERDMHAFQFARAFCGLNDDQGKHWFSGWWTDKPLHKVTPQEALAFLDRQLAEAAQGYGEMVL